jgi:hypothetical protein
VIDVASNRGLSCLDPLLRSACGVVPACYSAIKNQWDVGIRGEGFVRSAQIGKSSVGCLFWWRSRAGCAYRIRVRKVSFEGCPVPAGACSLSRPASREYVAVTHVAYVVVV